MTDRARADDAGDALTPSHDGVLETALYVADLDRSERFWGRLLDARTLFADHRLRALDVGGRQVLLLFVIGGSERPTQSGGGTIPPHGAEGRQHLAFAVPASALATWERRLREQGIAVESRVNAPRGGRCVYFRDPDGHLVELATPGVWETY